MDTPRFLSGQSPPSLCPDRWINRLSEAYENQQGELNLELRVVTININEGCNQKLMEQCRILSEYAQYVEKVRINAEVIAMSIFEYDKEEEEQKLKNTYIRIGEKRGERRGSKRKARNAAIKLAKKGDPLDKIGRVFGYDHSKIHWR